MIVHNEYEFDAGNNVELIERTNSTLPPYYIAGMIRSRPFGIEANSFDEARATYCTMVALIRQIN